MDMVQEMYNLCSNSSETEEALIALTKDLMEYIESNIEPNEKAVFLDTIESVIKNRESYFFQAGFRTAKDLIVN